MKKKGNLKKKIMGYFAMVLLLFLVGVPIFNLLLWKLSDNRPHIAPLIIGHRGAAGLAPENTLTAIDSGIAHKAAFVEIDIRETSDGELIVMHDKTVDRTTNGKGAVQDLKLSQIQALSANNAFKAIKQKVSIPTLREVLMRIKETPATDLLIEIKNPELYPNLVEKLVSLLNETGTVNRVLVNSFDYEVIKKVKTALPNVRTGVFRLAGEGVADLKNIDYICPSWYSILYFPSIINKIQKKGCKAFVWTVDNEMIMQYLMNKNVDGIITDRPDKLTEVIAAKAIN